MNKNISEEIIEIDGKEYTLFVNRIGIVNWEKATKLASTIKNVQDKYSKEDDVVFDDNCNPFESNYDIDDDEKELYDIYSKFYWMALYTHHKLSINEANDLFYKAIDEYGINQLAELAQQMIEAINTDNRNLKNLKALKSTK